MPRPKRVAAVAAQFLDYDNDGLLDLFEISSGSAHLFRNLGSRWENVSRQAGLEELTKNLAPQSMAIGDLDSDGYADVVLRLANGELRRWGARGSRNYSFGVSLTARVSNRSSVGAKVEVRAGSLRQKLERSSATPAVAPSDLVFGLGPRTDGRRRPRDLAVRNPSERNELHRSRWSSIEQPQVLESGADGAGSQTFVVSVPLHVERLAIRIRDRLHGRRGNGRLARAGDLDRSGSR